MPWQGCWLLAHRWVFLHPWFGSARSWGEEIQQGTIEMYASCQYKFALFPLTGRCAKYILFFILLWRGWRFVAVLHRLRLKGTIRRLVWFFFLKFNSKSYYHTWFYFLKASREYHVILIQVKKINSFLPNSSYFYTLLMYLIFSVEIIVPPNV